MNIQKQGCQDSENKSIAIMQPYLFPYLGYFQLMQAADIFVILDDVNYINKGFINRNFILLNGQSYRITLALLGASQNKLINGITISNNAPRILKTIAVSYKKAPFFQEVFPILNSLFLHNEKNLARFIGHSLQILANTLALNTKFVYSSEINKDNTLKAQYKMIEICHQLKINTYLNAIGGMQLYDKMTFKNHRIDLFFIKSHLQKYMQFNNEFVPNLSIIDVLMFNQNEDIKKMLAHYELV